MKNVCVPPSAFHSLLAAWVFLPDLGATRDLPEEGRFILDARRDEIRSAASVIVPTEANGITHNLL
jgi:hypothetical protein